MRHFFLATILCTFALTSCNKSDDQDIVKPMITLSAPLKDAIFSPGEEIHFEAELVDNDELKSYKIDIHSAHGHSHSKATEIEWSFQKEFDISGKRNHLAHEHFEIPEDAKAGEYHFVIYCTDRSGNEQVAFTNFTIN